MTENDDIAMEADTETDGAVEPEPAAAEATSRDPEGAVTEATEADASQAETAEAPQDPLEAAQAEIKRLRDQLLRTAADFDNYRKRSRREVIDAEEKGRKELLEDLLPVFDNLERATSHAQAATEVKSLADGVSMVMRQFLDTLGKMGIERVEAEGKPFDPAVHEAIQQLETTDVEPGTITHVVQAGYTRQNRLIRPAMVVVAKRPPNEQSGT